MEEASCRSSCPLEAAEAPSLPAAHGTAQPPPPKLRKDVKSQRSQTQTMISTDQRTNFTFAYLFCRSHQPLYPSFPCCWRPRPCKGRLWPGRSTGSRWSRRNERGIRRHRASFSGCFLGLFWDGWPLPATTLWSRKWENKGFDDVRLTFPI